MNKKLFSIVITVVLLASIITADQMLQLGLGKKVSSLIAPVGIVFSVTGQKVSNFFGNITHIGSLQRENKDLTDKLNSALTEIAGLSEAKKENDSLRLDLGFKLSSPLSLVPANVAYFDPSLRDGITVKTDSVTGIKIGNVVLAQGFLIGRVAAINGNSIRVMLITDSLSTIPATIQNKDISGIAAGKIGNGLTMEQVPQGDAVVKGDSAITSGLGGDLPKGLILGRVDEVQKIAGSIFQQVAIQPMVDFTSLERVMIAR